MPFLTKSDILSQPALFHDVEVAEWAGTVRVKAPTMRDNMRIIDALTIREREIEDYNADQLLPEDERKGLPKVERFDDTLIQIIFAIADEKNEPLFDPFEDYEQVLNLSISSVNVIFATLVSLRSVAKATESVEVLKKSSSRTRNGGSSSGSRSR